MTSKPEPSSSNAYDAAHLALVFASYQKLLGQPLFAAAGQSNAAELAYHAKFALLTHDASSDPLFNYANLTAQRLFEMSWEEIVGAPSRSSAEAACQQDRQKWLALAASQGYVSDYHGVRIAKSGARFLISQVKIWNVYNEQGAAAGQAAYFDQWRILGQSVE